MGTTAFVVGTSVSSQQERYVPSTEQLVVELFVDDLDRSIAFYRDLGFLFVRREETFAELSWEGHLFFLDATQPSPNVDAAAANLRIMVTDVDIQWERIESAKARVLKPIGAAYRDKSIDLRPGEEWPIVFHVVIGDGVMITSGSDDYLG